MAMGERRDCPACGSTTFCVETFPADTVSVWCADCGNRVALAAIEDANVDSRWTANE
jgi:ribosomal protein S27AE